MNTEVVKRRIGQVLRVDSIDSSECDFLATHVPFHSISVVSGIGDKMEESTYTEEEIYKDIFQNEQKRNEHQFVIVEGSSGAGKSHFIRWLSARLNISDMQDEVVLLIRRSDNTLKGTIRQLLAREEVQQITNREVYERLVRANQTLNETKFKLTLYHQFIVELENELESGKGETLSNVKLKKLIALFHNSDFQEKMMEAGGPIERIYNKIKSTSSDIDLDSIAQFTYEDMTLDLEFVEKLDYADKKARDFANSLMEGSDTDFIHKVTDYINSFVETVIQTSAGIEPGDFEQIFKEIRQELHRQGKNLILLVEDITSFTGINQALLQALITGHTGKNAADNMCRLISVVGTTSQYYQQFRDNYRDRITKQITIHEGALGDNPQDLLQFVARYLNAVSLEESTLNEWITYGANTDDMPVFQSKEHDVWDKFELTGKNTISLYPFTKRAILNLYDAMPDQKTPRYILRDIVEPAIREVISDVSSFPKFCISSEWKSNLSEAVENRIGSITSSLNIPDSEKSDYRKRLVAFIRFWTDKTLDVTSDEKISGISKEIFKELGFEAFTDKLTRTSVVVQADNKNISDKQNVTVPKTAVQSDKKDISKPEKSKIMPKVDPQKQKQYDSFKQNVISWHRDGGVLIQSLKVREEISNFVYETVNWQQEGVSLDSEDRFKKSVGSKLIGFRRQDQAEDKCFIILEDTEETYQLLLCFGKWLYLGKRSWNFPDSASAVFFATSWLERNKSKFVDIISNIPADDFIPDYVKASMIGQVYKKILNGTIGKTIDTETFLMQDDVGNDVNGHCKSWNDAHKFIFDNPLCSEMYTASVRYFNLIQGTQLKTNNYLLNYPVFYRAIQEIKDSGYIINDEINELDKNVKEKRELLEYALKITKRLHTVVQDEISLAREKSEEVLKYFGFDMEDEIEERDIRTLLDGILDFYNKCYSSGINIGIDSAVKDKIGKLKDYAKNISYVLNFMKEDHSGEDDIFVLMTFAKNPIKIIMPLLNLLHKADSDAENVINIMKAEKKALIQQGNWTTAHDERFDERKDNFKSFYNSFMEVK